MGRQKPAQLWPETVYTYTNRAGHTLHVMPAHQLNSGGNRKGLGTEVWGLATRAREPGTDRRNDGHFLPPLQTSQSRTRVYNPRTNKQRTTVAVPRVLNVISHLTFCNSDTSSWCCKYSHPSCNPSCNWHHFLYMLMTPPGATVNSTTLAVNGASISCC